LALSVIGAGLGHSFGAGVSGVSRFDLVARCLSGAVAGPASASALAVNPVGPVATGRAVSTAFRVAGTGRRPAAEKLPRQRLGQRRGKRGHRVGRKLLGTLLTQRLAYLVGDLFERLLLGRKPLDDAHDDDVLLGDFDQ